MKSILIAGALVLLCVGADLRAEDGSGRYQVKVSWYERPKDAPKLTGAFGYGPSRSSGPTKQKSAEASMEELGGKEVLQVVLPMCKDRTVVTDARIPYPHEGPSKGRPGEGWDGAVSWMETKGNDLALKIKFGVSALYGDKEHPSVSRPMMEITPTLSLDTPLFTMGNEFGMIVELQKADSGPEFLCDWYECPQVIGGGKIGGFAPLDGKESITARFGLDATEKIGSLRIPLVKEAKVTVRGLPKDDGTFNKDVPFGTVKWIPAESAMIYRLEMEARMDRLVKGQVGILAIDNTTIELQNGYGMAMGGLVQEGKEVIFIVGVAQAKP